MPQLPNIPGAVWGVGPTTKTDGAGVLFLSAFANDALRAARAEAARQYAERDYGYGAVIGELGKLIDQSLAQEALAARAAEIARVVEAVGDLGDIEVRRRRGGG